MRHLWRMILGGVIVLSGVLVLLSQPERLAYFPHDTAFYAPLDPGDEILSRNLLITNQNRAANVSFKLSFDNQAWNRFALGPYYSSIFDLRGAAGSYIEVRTRRADNTVVPQQYFLPRGRCYSIYWNRARGYWDVQENPCHHPEEQQ